MCSCWSMCGFPLRLHLKIQELCEFTLPDQEELLRFCARYPRTGRKNPCQNSWALKAHFVVSADGTSRWRRRGPRSFIRKAPLTSLVYTSLDPNFTSHPRGTVWSALPESLSACRLFQGHPQQSPLQRASKPKQNKYDYPDLHKYRL